MVAALGEGSAGPLATRASTLRKLELLGAAKKVATDIVLTRSRRVTGCYRTAGDPRLFGNEKSRSTRPSKRQREHRGKHDAEAEHSYSDRIIGGHLEHGSLRG
jgi:hypothetical protein